MVALLNRKIDLENWLIFSSIASVFLIVRLFHAGIDVFAGYPIVLFNSVIMLILGRLVIHRNHAILIGLLALTSIVAGRFSSTPITSTIAQIIGIALMSVGFLSVLLTSRLTVPRWMDLYASAAFYLAIFGIIRFAVQRLLHIDIDGDQRLKSIFVEPSLFVYTTLPAIGFYVNKWITERRYGTETFFFLLAYALADSSLGFFGLLLIGTFTYVKRFTVWHGLAAATVSVALLGVLFAVSENFALRVNDTTAAVASQSVANTNGSTFALLSNLYVAANAVMDYPVLGVGIGGYAATYDFYIHDLGEKDLKNNLVGLNKDDANSLFLRVVAELGPIGLIALLGFLIVCARVDGKPYRQIRNALLPYMIVRMARFGAYFSMELYFFVGLYLLNYLDYRRSIAVDRPRPAPAQAALHPV